MNFFKNLFLLSRATEREVASQAQQRVQKSIEEANIEKILKEELNNQIERICDNISKKENEEIQSVQKTRCEVENNIGNQVKIVESFMTQEKDKIEVVLVNAKCQMKKFDEEVKESRRDLDETKAKLQGKINGAIAFLGILAFITILGIPSITPYFLNINTLKIEIEHLKSDIEDLNMILNSS